MTETKSQSIDRRDFMLASIATAGSVTLASRQAQAQTGDAKPDTDGKSSGTIYTGHVIDGKRVISFLDISDLEAGKRHNFYFQGVQMPTGQHWHVSVTVMKGKLHGKRIGLISGVHGDEMSRCTHCTPS